MMMQEKEFWIDTRLSDEEMDFLRDVIATSVGEVSEDEHWKENAAGKVTRCDLMDKDNWFYKTVVKKLTERMFYQDWDNYYMYHIVKEEPPPKFEMHDFWVNYMKQYDHVPIHNHIGLYSFVIFIKIPTHWKDQHVLPMQLKSNVITPTSHPRSFMFVWRKKYREMCNTTDFSLSSEDEGRMLFFPAYLQHQVYPFYRTEENRVTISGNIRLYDPNRPKEQRISYNSNRPKEQRISSDEYEEKEKTLKLLENTVKQMKDQLKQMKKAREKEGEN
jgi:hypothetical protein